MIEQDLLEFAALVNRQKLQQSKLRGVQVATELVLAEVWYGALKMASGTRLFDLQKLLGMEKIDEESYGKEGEKKDENVSLLHYFKIVKQSAR